MSANTKMTTHSRLAVSATRLLFDFLGFGFRYLSDALFYVVSKILVGNWFAAPDFDF